MVSKICVSNMYQSRFMSRSTRIVITDSLPALAYKPKIVERNKYDNWENKKIFEAKDNDDPVFSMVLPPPNVTGKLHLGHALSCTIQDVIARRKRSLGHNVTWVPDRHDIGRDKFNIEVWKWKEKYGNTITEQLRLMGCSLDWSNEIFTMDENHSHAVTTAFINLFQKGMIYRKKALVNWCNALKSTVSDIEVDNISIDGLTEMMLPGYKKAVKFGQMYTFRYQIFDSNEIILVSTTMPETMLGDTAIAVHPEDERYTHLRGRRAIHPFRDSCIPIIFDEFVDMTFGTGAVKITPAHSKVDYEIAKRHHLKCIEVITENGTIKNAGKFDALKKYDCRELLLKELEDLGLLYEVKSHQMTLPICSRTGDVIEYLLKEQWFLACKNINIKAAKAVSDGQLSFDPENCAKLWEHWTGDCRDWCISRQLWWGHQIPAYKCSVDKDFVWIAATNETTAKVEASKFLRTLPDMITVVRDTDVLDTWFSSGVYPFSAFGWPEHNYKQKYKRFYPLSLMVTGHDILGFWVHRMVMLGLELTDKLPFHKVLLHGIICDNKGAKMSKSRGNVIDPVDVINGLSMEDLKEKAAEAHKEGGLTKEEYNRALAFYKSNFTQTNGIPECGVDALRFTLLSHDIKSRFVSFDIHQCNANKLFCNKIWQSIKYIQLSFDKLKPTDNEVTKSNLTYFDKWILSRLSDMVHIVNKSMDAHEFHTATKALKKFIYGEFCDIYLETTKLGFDSNDSNVSYAHGHTLSAALSTALRCLSPFMIYLTSEVIPKIPRFESNIIVNFNDTHNDYFDFPSSKDFECWRDVELEKDVDKLLSTVFLIRELKGFYGVSNKIRPSVVLKSSDSKLCKSIQNNFSVVLALCRCSNIVFEEQPNVRYVNSFLNKSTEVLLEIKGDDVDNTISKAKSKLQKKIKKLEENLEVIDKRSKHQDLDMEKIIAKREELKRLQRLM
ncbi:unnamed protein product [Leptidea sinapis]|uniref:valine--tRNA ligase n=1 Tax=Leptidea sinapis TaxID=189913 RepID=A0A5E4QUV2_9NEOP|nr:unnamed protein product [Leptidea sinapis]